MTLNLFLNAFLTTFWPPLLFFKKKICISNQHTTGRNITKKPENFMYKIICRIISKSCYLFLERKRCKIWLRRAQKKILLHQISICHRICNRKETFFLLFFCSLIVLIRWFLLNLFFPFSTIESGSGTTQSSTKCVYLLTCLFLLNIFLLFRHYV